MARQSSLPQHRLNRLLHLGRLASGVAGGAVSEGLRQWSAGRRPRAQDLLLTPGNAARLSERLAEMRGAAMKVGQLLSMEAGEFLPPELTQVLARLREDAHQMPLGEVAAVLAEAWGKGWERDFARFSFTPMAAASIGQVHEARSKDGRHLAIKVQYPGVRRSIDSDVDNVAALLRWSRMLPPELDLNPLLEEAKRQLHVEADYHREADHLEAYQLALGHDHPLFVLPQVDRERTASDVLTMTYVGGDPIESLASATQEVRDEVATRLVHLALRELFDWGLVQTDPNFGNYRYQPENQKIGLLDFGAVRRYPAERVEVFRQLLHTALDSDIEAIADAATAVGYLGVDDGPRYRHGIAELGRNAAEPARQAGPYDFASSSLARRMSELLVDLRMEQRFLRVPPPDVLFLHRKLGGLYLLCSRLKARVDVSEALAPYLSSAQTPVSLPATSRIAHSVDAQGGEHTA